MPTQINGSQNTPIYTLDANGNQVLAGDVTLGTSTAPYPLIPQKGTVTIYSPDAKSVNLLDSSGNITVLSSGGGGDVGDFTSVNVNPGPLNVTGQTNLTGATTNSSEIVVSVTGDTQARYAVNANGVMNWGDGTDATDTNLYRGAAGLLQTDSSFEVSAGNLTVADGAAFVTGGSVTVSRGVAGNPILNGLVTADTNDRFTIDAAGDIKWGSGSATFDSEISRTGVATLTVTGTLVENGGTNTSGAAAVLTPTFSTGVAAQLSDVTRDYMVYLTIGTAGTANTLAIGPTSGVAHTLISSAVATSGEMMVVRLPAGWYLKWTATTATLATQTAIGC